MQNQNSINEKTAEGNTMTSTTIEQQQFVHPLLMPSLVCHITGYFSQLKYLDRILFLRQKSSYLEYLKII